MRMRFSSLLGLSPLDWGTKKKLEGLLMDLRLSGLLEAEGPD